MYVVKEKNVMFLLMVKKDITTKRKGEERL